MRAKPSFTAIETYSCSGSLTPPLPIRANLPDIPGGLARAGMHSFSSGFALRPASRRLQECATAAQGAGLLHDARNLMGALGLYCDLLSMPGVLRPEHLHYPEELRQLGERSSRLIEHMMHLLHAQGGVDSVCPGAAVGAGVWGGGSPARIEARAEEPVDTAHGGEGKLASLRAIVERSVGLLSRVAGGRAIEVTYGPAAAAPVRVSEESVERILVNLVRNAAAALRKCEPAAEGLLERAAGNQGDARDAEVAAGVFEGGRFAVQDGEEETDGSGNPEAIRVGVGLLVNRVGDAKPWPFRRVRLTVEDSGCGMTPAQVGRLMSGGRAPSRGCHGIGFRVVRELVAASEGDLRMISSPGVGTRVQIEWPLAMLPATETEGESGSGAPDDRRLGSQATDAERRS